MDKREREKMLNRERSKRWREAHPERKKELNANWESKNPNYYSDYYNKNSERIKERITKYSKDKPHIKRDSDRKRRAKKYETRTENFTEKQVLELYGTDCYICNKPIDLTISGRPGYPNWEQGLHIDHVVALVNGGTNTLDNVRPTHGICNLHKGRKV